MNEVCRKELPAGELPQEATEVVALNIGAPETGCDATPIALVAEVEEASAGEADTAAALAELDRRIRELEAAMGDLRSITPATPMNAAAGPVIAGRKTQESCAPRLMSKAADTPAAGAVNDALRSLSPEQRLAVKAGLLRAGLL